MRWPSLAMMVGGVLVGGGLSACADDGPPVPAAGVAVAASGCSASDDVARGVVVADGHVLTVGHALRDALAVTVDGEPGVVVAIDPRLDAALVAVPTAERPTAMATGVAPGPATVSGQPITVSHVVTAEVEEPVDATTYTRRALVLDADLRRGDSGAGVLAPDGTLLGMVFATSTRTDGVAYAVTADELAPFVAAALAEPAEIPLTCD